MNDDLLQRAANVVRERYDGESQLAAGSELRVTSAFARRTRSTRRAPLVAIPLLAALLGSAAWAVGSAKLRDVLALGSPATAVSVPSAHKAAAHAAGSPPLAPTPEMPHASTEPTTVALPSTQASSAAPVRSLVASVRAVQRAPAISNAPAAPAQPAESATSAPPESEISALYRAAHRAQFSGGDPVQALALWDRYLGAAPNGALSPEARYNRAITLARLGRKAEAARALEPFARGDYGGYRRAEAASLLQVLRPAAP